MKSLVVLALLLVAPVSYAQTLGGAQVDLLWQADGYVPPFYQGRALWGRQTRITFYAIPHVAGNRSTLIYRWSENGEVLGTSSGVGKSSLTLSDSILGIPKTITIDIMSDQSTVLASASLALAPDKQELHIYENDPLLGYRWEREVSGTKILEGQEVSFSAFPLFFSTSKRTGAGLTYSWVTNAGSAQAGSEVTYRAPETRGTARVSVSTRSSVRTLQTANKDFLVQFGE